MGLSLAFFIIKLLLFPKAPGALKLVIERLDKDILFYKFQIKYFQINFYKSKCSLNCKFNSKTIEMRAFRKHIILNCFPNIFVGLLWALQVVAKRLLYRILLNKTIFTKINLITFSLYRPVKLK